MNVILSHVPLGDTVAQHQKKRKKNLSILLKIRVAAGFPVYSETPFTDFSVTALLGNLQSNLLLACWTERFLGLPAYCHLVGGQVHLRASQEPMGCAGIDSESMTISLSNPSALFVLPQPPPPGTDSGV